jgi:membrane-associated phospholipid phosphatase
MLSIVELGGGTVFLDNWLLHVANHWVARSDTAFFQALSLSDQSSWVLAACAFVALWFAGEADTVGAQSVRISRIECRRRVLLIGLALPVSFFLARVLQDHVVRLRPLVNADMEIPIDPQLWQGIKSTLSLEGSFPSDHAVMFFVIITGALSINVWAGLLTLAIGLYYSILRVGIGFHWPSDVLAGALLGILATLLLFAIKPRLVKILDLVILQFDRYPAVTYPLSFLMLLDLSQKFSMLFYLLSLVLNHPIEH